MSFNHKKKYMSITYKDTNYKEAQFSQQNFTGFKIIKERDKISYINEYYNGEEVSSISFRPTQTPVIFSVRYGNYHEERYTNNKVSSKYYAIQDRVSGEYRKYDSYGNISEVKYFNNGINCTDEIKSFIGFNGTDEEFMNYEFSEDETFNVMMRYGSNFKFLHEFGIDSNHFDTIVQNCN